MHALAYDAELCARCETCDCLMRCQYLDFGLAEAREQRQRLIRGEDNVVVGGCVTCYACEEYCPHGNHPFYLIVERQEQLGIHPVPKPIERSQVIAMEPKGTIRSRELTAPLIDLCSFGMFKGSLRGRLFEGTSTVAGLDIFCNLMYLHFARHSTIAERLPGIIANLDEYYLRPNGIDEVVCFHDECYGTFTSWAAAYGLAVPFRPVHFFDFLHRRLLGLAGEIQPLGLKVAYQRPCSNRLCPQTDKFVDDIFALIGVARAAREHDHERALCCGGPLEVQQRFDLVEDIQHRNIEDMRAAGVSHCVFNCPFCLWTLGEKVFKAGIVPVMMSDLCQRALSA